MKPAVLSAEGLCKSFGATRVLDGVSIRVDEGECVALVGESGAGKTTLLRCFNRLVDPDEGTVHVLGRDVRTFEPSALRRQLGYVPQDGGLLPHWRVLRNVALVPRLLGAPDAVALGRIALDRVGLSPGRFEGRWPRELSGGQRQRVALARALAAEPRVVLLDEPFGALDAITRGELVNGFGRLHRALGFSMVLVTHDLREARALADRIGVMRDGRMVQLSDWRSLCERPCAGYVSDLLARAGVLDP